ncbi:MAG: hypothetical protein R3D43_00700 [Tepidamorphaceae bacterium]|nr:hypothetical protein [Rhodobiaceae bacterium]MCC0047760.1 hypothetical protein [Rhodobiaceae bacterium]
MAWSKRNPASDETVREVITVCAPQLPSPEEVFLAWLVHLPPHADIAKAAAEEIARIDSSSPLLPQAKRLREIFSEAAHEAGRWKRGISHAS